MGRILKLNLGLAVRGFVSSFVVLTKRGLSLFFSHFIVLIDLFLRVRPLVHPFVY